MNPEGKYLFDNRSPTAREQSCLQPGVTWLRLDRRRQPHKDGCWLSSSWGGEYYGLRLDLESGQLAWRLAGFNGRDKPERQRRVVTELRPSNGLLSMLANSRE